jgi:hypothetical protein
MGSIIFVAGILYDEIVSIQTHSLLVMLSYLTHCSIAVGVFCLVIRTCISILAGYLNDCIGQGFKDILDDLIGVFTVSSMSIFTFLFFATVSLISSYTGLLLGPDSYEFGPQKYARSLVAAVLEHWLPILIVLPLYRTRQVANLSQTWKFVIWIATLVITVGIWVTALLLQDRQPTDADAYKWSDQLGFVSSVLLGTLVPWALVSLV